MRTTREKLIKIKNLIGEIQDLETEESGTIDGLELSIAREKLESVVKSYEFHLKFEDNDDLPFFP